MRRAPHAGADRHPVMPKRSLGVPQQRKRTGAHKNPLAPCYSVRVRPGRRKQEYGHLGRARSQVKNHMFTGLRRGSEHRGHWGSAFPHIAQQSADTLPGRFHPNPRSCLQQADTVVQQSVAMRRARARTVPGRKSPLPFSRSTRNGGIRNGAHLRSHCRRTPFHTPTLIATQRRRNVRSASANSASGLERTQTRSHIATVPGCGWAVENRNTGSSGAPFRR